jgi:MFS transporter, PHS family, inorganic phosphate transporter
VKGRRLDGVAPAGPARSHASSRLDKIGHRRLQLPGFAMMALCFLIVAAIPRHDHSGRPVPAGLRDQLLLHRVRPNMTTFVMPGELYQVTMRATEHGVSAGIDKLGAFIGVFLFPLLND